MCTFAKKKKKIERDLGAEIHFHDPERDNHQYGHYGLKLLRVINGVQAGVEPKLLFSRRCVSNKTQHAVCICMSLMIPLKWCLSACPQGLITQSPARDLFLSDCEKGGLTSAPPSWSTSSLTCLLFSSSFLCALYRCLFLDLFGLWYALQRCPFRASPWVLVLVRDSGVAPVWGCKSLWRWLSSTLWCQSIHRISYFLLALPPSPFIYTGLYGVDVPELVRVLYIHKPAGHAVGEAHVHTHRHEHTAVFPSSRICSIFPRESCGIRPISFILPVSSCLALKCVWSLRDFLCHYSWTSLFFNCLHTFNEFSQRQIVGGR